MSEEIRVGPKENAFASNEERINYVLKLRSELMRSKPITDQKITKLDKWLIAQPALPIAAVVQIWTRMMWVSAAEYAFEQDQPTKHLNLLSLRTPTKASPPFFTERWASPPTSRHKAIASAQARAAQGVGSFLPYSISALVGKPNSAVIGLGTTI
jgi:hypothetical protein